MGIIMILQLASTPFKSLYIYEYHVDYERSTVKKLLKMLCFIINDIYYYL